MNHQTQPQSPQAAERIEQEAGNDAARQGEINAIGAGAQTADPFVDVVVSGQPAGGSDALDAKNADESDDLGEAHPS